MAIISLAQVFGIGQKVDRSVINRQKQLNILPYMALGKISQLEPKI